MGTNRNEEEEGTTAATGTTSVPGYDSFQDTAGVEKAIKILEDRVTETIGLASDGKP